MATRSLNLVIGCGGSGLTTLSALNRLLVQNPDMLQRMSDEIYYLVVDTEVSALDAFEKDVKEQMGQYASPFMERIQLSQDMNILNDMIRPNFIEPFSREPNAKGLMRLREHWWFDENGNPFQAARVTNLMKGAGQCPPASYGLAWYRLDAIGEAVKRIVDRMVTHGFGDPSQLRNMNLIVVAGLSGGTGRGCWNVIAFKVREYLQSKYKVKVPPVGVFFDANVYDCVARDNVGQRIALEVNSLTGLSELSCWLVNGGRTGSDSYEYRLPNIKSPDKTGTDILKVDLDINPTAGAPVNSAFLVCGRSESAILEDNRQYHEMAGAALYAMIANPDIAARQVNDGDPFNSLAAAAIEQVCDEAERLIAERVSEPYFTFRFSPGYGDYPLDTQKRLLRLLDAPRKIGLSLNDSLLLTPVKSVTAVIGLSDQPIPRGKRGCAICSLRETCAYRRKGTHCGFENTAE